ncbi:putative periplasmic protein (DUF2233) [Gloeocapsa sp. PCC 73106]|nr:putative periplasmic protein (DUF2233) [Gloeocapsa sp. PCC 73106]
MLIALLLHLNVSSQTTELQYRTYDLPQALIHTLLIPRTSNFVVTVAQTETLATVAEFAEQYGAIASLNGGFFDPHNQLSTSYLVQNGRVIATPQDNPRLVGNPDLKPYLPQIFNRSEFRRYQCFTGTRYALTQRSDPIPTGCMLVDALGAGPRLLPENTSTTEAFLAYAEGKLIRDALGSKQKNARTAIALTPEGDVLWIMVAQKSTPSGDSGLSLEQLAAFCRSLGVKAALNLDGGSSSSLYWEGKTYYGKVSRPVKSVLLLRNCQCDRFRRV